MTKTHQMVTGSSQEAGIPITALSKGIAHAARDISQVRLLTFRVLQSHASPDSPLIPCLSFMHSLTCHPMSGSLHSSDQFHVAASLGGSIPGYRAYQHRGWQYTIEESACCKQAAVTFFHAVACENQLYEPWRCQHPAVRACLRKGYADLRSLLNEP